MSIETTFEVGEFRVRITEQDDRTFIAWFEWGRDFDTVYDIRYYRTLHSALRNAEKRVRQLAARHNPVN